MLTKGFKIYGFVLLACFIFFNCKAGVAQTGKLSPNCVWLYLPFESSLDSIIPSTGLNIIKFSAPGKNPEFVDGINGKALRITETNKARFSFYHGIRNFPLEQGSVVIWFKPVNDMPSTYTWILDGGWASFDIHIEGQRLLFYSTSNAQHFLIGDLKGFIGNWKNNWHCIVGTWDRGVNNLFFDGKKIAHLENVAPLKSSPFAFNIGFLPGREDNASGFVNADVDELAILNMPLGETQVQELYSQGKNGLLAFLGGDIIAQLPRQGYLRGEKIPIRIIPYVNGDTIVVSAISQKTKNTYKLREIPCQQTVYELDSMLLRPGRYRLCLEVMQNKKPVVRNESVTFGIWNHSPDEFPLGIDALSLCSDDLLTEMEKWNINLSSGAGDDPEGFCKKIDRLFLYGIRYQLNFNIHYHRALEKYVDNRDLYFKKDGTLNENGVQELLQGLVLEDGSFYSTSLGTPFSKVGRKAMLARIKDIIDASQNHPGLHSISFDDEYCFRMGIDPRTKKPYYGDYSRPAIEYFKEKSGLDTMFLPPKEPPPTVFPDNHPYFKWKDIIGLPGDATTEGLRMNNAEQTEFIHKIRPDILTTAWSGGEYGECDAVMDYTYPTIWQPHPGYECGHARLDFMFDRHRARQRVNPLKPVWGLIGWWSGDLEGKPDWCVQDFRLNTIMALTKGAKLILWFTCYGLDPVPPGKIGGGLFSRNDLFEETKNWASWIHQFGPMFMGMETKPSKNVAVFLSEENTAGMLHISGPVAFDRFYPAMRIAGVPVDIVTDEQVKSGILDSYQALCLFRFQYANQSLWNYIKKFAETPGKVIFCDRETKLVPDGAVILDYNVLETEPGKWGMEVILKTMEKQVSIVREKMLPKIKPDNLQITGSSFVAPHWLYGGNGKLLSLVNYNIFNPESIEVKLLNTGGVVYDLLEKKIVAESSQEQPLQWKTNIDRANWKPYVVLPQRIENLNASVKFNNGKFEILIQVLGRDGKPLYASLPLHVQFKSPDGKEVKEYETYTAIHPEKGTAEMIIPYAGLMDLEGLWSIDITEMVSGKKITKTVNVKR